MTRHHIGTIVGGVVAIALTLGAYMGGYYAMLAPQHDFPVEFQGDWWLEPGYRVESPIAEEVFWPAHQLDLWLRPTRWETDMQDWG